MNIPAIRTALDAVLIPTTIRTLGSEKAVSLLEEHSDGLHIGLNSRSQLPILPQTLPTPFKKPSFRIPAILTFT